MFTDDQLRTRDLDALKQILRERLGGYRIAIKDIRAGNRVFRGVEWAERPTTIPQISYPPPEYVTRLGRVNREHVSMFYCSVAGAACFYELHARAGQCIALSEWLIGEPIWMHNLGFHPDALRRLGGGGELGREHFARPIPDETSENEQLRRELSLAFTEDVRGDDDAYRYKQSIAIFELLFGGADPLPLHIDGPRFTRASGAVYPAMGLRGSADNLVLFPEFVHEALTLMSVMYVLVEGVDVEKSAYRLLTLARSRSFAGNDIEWETLTTPEIDRRSYIALEDGQWVMRDGYGKEYFRR